jgi:hypothetical protein
MSEIEVSKRLRIFLANRLIALGWALKGACKPCVQRLFITARWLVPEAERFLVQRTGSYDRNRRIIEWLFSSIQPRVVGGFLIVLALVGLLDLAMQTTATHKQPLVENSAFLSAGKSTEPMQAFVSETASISETQIASVPLPQRKPERVHKVPNGKGAKANLAIQKRMAQQKRLLLKPAR